MKKLTLNKETLRELTDGDLDRAAGGFPTLACPPRTVKTGGGGTLCPTQYGTLPCVCPR